MKKIFITITLGLTFSATVFGQIKTNQNVSQGSADGLTPFLDASGSSFWNNTTNIGKGIVYPRVDLSTLEVIAGPERPGDDDAPTYYDGMVVYNTKEGVPPAIGGGENLKRGFYYYKNDGDDFQDGIWVRIADITDLQAGIASGEFWSLAGNGNTTPVTLKGDNTEGINKYTITAGSFLGTTDPQSLTVGTNNIARLNIGALPQEDVGGKDFDFVLKVYGKAKFDDGIVTKASTYPDYVFDNYFTGKSDENPNYEFKKLNEVEKFIKENNHLPGVTSIRELNKSEKGYNIDNTQLSIQTLEKVEELYLHVIEQQKEIQALKAEIAELKK